MSETPNEMKLVNFALVVDGEVATVLSMYENSAATIAALSSDPKVVIIPDDLADLVRGSDPVNPWTWDGTTFRAPE